MRCSEGGLGRLVLGTGRLDKTRNAGQNDARAHEFGWGREGEG